MRVLHYILGLVLAVIFFASVALADQIDTLRPGWSVESASVEAAV